MNKVLINSLRTTNHEKKEPNYLIHSLKKREEIINFVHKSQFKTYTHTHIIFKKKKKKTFIRLQFKYSKDVSIPSSHQHITKTSFNYNLSFSIYNLQQYSRPNRNNFFINRWIFFIFRIVFFFSLTAILAVPVQNDFRSF